ncbi:MAG: peptidase C11, partial [Firmicutes bacterium]|nr:peptidase C11 [Bacillota bacterium]
MGSTGSSGSSSSVSAGAASNTGKLNTSVDPSARSKYTKILGSGKDTVTIMVYMCGSDLESRSGMGTSDLSEMAAATLSDKVNLLVYTGGATTWKNNVVSSSVCQIYKVENGKFRRLVENDGSNVMTNPATLSRFIKYCTENYPANRNELILWDHGGGSISGYGYDEKNPRSGSMGLSSISKALKDAGTRFDFIGFDACLMGTLENALTLTPYADYLIASEETEPGIGWYYTNWLTALAADTSMSTLEIGKNIVDDFVTTCDRKCNGQKTTLSVVDLAELEKTVPTKFKAFSQSLSGMLENKEYTAVSNARVNAREFAVSSKVDQVDLVDLANRLNTTESKALAETLLKAVKYNRTSTSITNAYGISIYFPYQQRNRVSSAVNAYNAIGLDSEYTRCIQQFASVQGAGQTVASAGSGSISSPLGSLMGGSTGGSMVSSDLISGLMSSFLSGGGSYGLTGKALDADALTEYISANRLNPEYLCWQHDGSGYVLALPEDQWRLVHSLNLSVYFDDGEGFIDLGLDNVF